MKITIDTTAKTIQLGTSITVQQLNDELKKMNLDPKEYKIIEAIKEWNHPLDWVQPYIQPCINPLPIYLSKPELSPPFTITC